jgi:predicted nucleotidyltransferase
MVEFEPGAKSYDNFLRLSLLLEDILGRRVELLTRESLSPYIGPRILEEAENVALGA